MHDNFFERKDINPNLLSISDVTKRLGISRRTLSRIRSRGEFVNPVMIGNSPKWSDHDLQRWIANGGCQANQNSSLNLRSKKSKGRTNG